MRYVLRILAVQAALLAGAGHAAAQDHESHGDASAADSLFRQVTVRGFSDFTFRLDSTPRAGERTTAGAFALGQFSVFMDGFEATQEIRRRESGRARTRIVALTAGVLPEDRARALAGHLATCAG